MRLTSDSKRPEPKSRAVRWTATLAFGALVGAILTTGTLALATPAYAVGAAPVALGRAAPFAVLAGASVGNTVTGPVTVVRGDLGVAAPAGTIGGFPPGLVSGTKYAPGAAAVTGAMADLVLAYADAEGRSPALPLPGDLIGLTFHPGIYGNIGAVANTGTVTLDSQGVADSVFIFQIGAAFSMAAGAKVTLTGGTQAKNVFWQANGAAALGAGAEFAGTLMTAAAISVGAGTLFNGRALAKTGAIALNSNQFYSSPPVVTINGGSAAVVADDTPTISGTSSVDDGATVIVTIGSQALGAPVVTGGTWTVTSSLLIANGTYTVTATTSDVAGNSGSATQSLTIDTVLPVVTITGGGAVLTNDPTPTIAGTTDVAPGSIVTVTVGGHVWTTLVQTDGTWNVTPTALADGSASVVAAVHDEAGNPGSASQTLTIDTTAPSVIITGGATALSNDNTPTISGSSSAPPGSPVTVTFSGEPLSTSVQTDGTWAATASAHGDGSHPVVVLITDPAGNVGSAVQTLTIDTGAPSVAIAGGPDVTTNDNTPTISGTTSAAALSTITVTVGGQSFTTLVQAGGSWNATASPLTDGTYTVIASVPDPAGNAGLATQSLTIDTVAPLVTITGGASVLSNDPTPTIAGTTNLGAGSLVTVTVGVLVLSAIVQGDNTWNVTTPALADGTHSVTASVADPAGNPGVASQTLTIDTVAPLVTITGGATALSNDNTPTISGWTSAAPSSIITVTVDGSALTSVVQINGSWYVTAAALADGAHSVLAAIPDPAGNTGSATQTLTIDTAVSPPSLPPPPPPVTAAAGYTPIGPKRVFDTRPGESPNALRSVPKTKIGGVYELEVLLTDLNGYVPATGVGAVSLNVTVTNPQTSGFVTVYPCHGRESVSSVNFTAGRTVANEVIAPVSASGTVCFYAMAATDLVVDINGWFAAGQAFTPVGPKRVFDTRPGESAQALLTVTKSPIPAAGIIEVHMAGLTGYVPASGVDSVSLNVTVTNPAASGYVTVYACGTRAVVSSVNYVAGQTVANAVIAPLSATGTVCFYTLAATDLVVDINGWFSTGSAFTGVNPQRVLDTRSGESANALRTVPKIKIGGGSLLEVKVTDLAGAIPAAGVSAVSLNVTVANPEGDGYVSVYPCGTRETVSSLNYTTSETVANAVLTRVTPSGTICFFSLVPVDLIVDINGWYAAS